VLCCVAISGVAPRIKIPHLDPSVVSSIRIVCQLEQDFRLYHMMFKELQDRRT